MEVHTHEGKHRITRARAHACTHAHAQESTPRPGTRGVWLSVLIAAGLRCPPGPAAQLNRVGRGRGAVGLRCSALRPSLALGRAPQGCSAGPQALGAGPRNSSRTRAVPRSSGSPELLPAGAGRPAWSAGGCEGPAPRGCELLGGRASGVKEAGARRDGQGSQRAACGRLCPRGPECALWRPFAGTPARPPHMLLLLAARASVPPGLRGSGRAPVGRAARHVRAPRQVGGAL